MYLSVQEIYYLLWINGFSRGIHEDVIRNHYMYPFNYHDERAAFDGMWTKSGYVSYPLSFTLHYDVQESL